MPVNILESKQIFTDILLPVNQRTSNQGNLNININTNAAGQSSMSGRTGGLLGANLGHNFSAPSESSSLSNAATGIYFYRYIGYQNKEEHIRAVNELNQKLSNFAALYVRFDGKIPQPYNMALTDKLGKLFDAMTENDIRGERLDNILYSAGVFAITRDDGVNSAFRSAFVTIMKQYCVNEPTLNLSIEKNFIIKLVLWASEYVPRLFGTRLDGHIPKVMYVGQMKKHDAYFLILLSQIGCDVLYINSENDGEYHKVDKYNAFSKIVEMPVRVPVDLVFSEVRASSPAMASSASAVPAQTQTQTQTSAVPTQQKRSTLLDISRPTKTTTTQQPMQTTQSVTTNANIANQTGEFSRNSGSRLVDRDRIIITLKKAVDIFEDIAFPLSKRVGYVGPPSPVLPVYFYRNIGIQQKDLNSEDEYYNKVYVLDKRLTSLGAGYVRFVDSIPAPDNQEIDQISRRYANVFAGAIPGSFDPRMIVSKIISAGILKNSKDKLLDNLINEAFDKIVKMYLSKERAPNQAKLQNFVYKLVVWLNRYSNNLNLGRGFSDNPKVMYYGDIKIHEAYFLILLSNIGCDVLYLTTEEAKDKPFLEIDPNEEYTTIVVNELMVPMQDFPEKERTIRKTTTAFTASRELENIIFNEEVGLFKPWQFEAYDTRPITLRTTYDELKILWQEDAKIRQEFRIENGCVYIPNLFAKIGGTLESLEQYWQDYKYFTKQVSTVVMKTVPFTSTKISRQEIYSLAYLLDNKGHVNMEQLQSSKYYKFGYLRTSLQKLMIHKLNELMSYENFKRPIDNNLRLQILATVISLDDALLKLIETFDYPWGVPKLVIYNNAKESFSDEDAIIIAYLNLIGLDIVIFTPTNYNTIEQKLKEDIFDRFQLPSIQYDLQVPAYIGDANEKGKSLFSRMFGK